VVRQGGPTRRYLGKILLGHKSVIILDLCFDIPRTNIIDANMTLPNFMAKIIN